MSGIDEPTYYRTPVPTVTVFLAQILYVVSRVLYFEYMRGKVTRPSPTKDAADSENQPRAESQRVTGSGKTKPRTKIECSSSPCL